MILFIVTQFIKKYKKEKKTGTIKVDLLRSVTETEDWDDSVLNETVRNVKQPHEVIAIIKQHEIILKEENKQIINIMSNFHPCLDNFTSSREFYQM